MGVSNDDEQCLCPTDGHIESLWVAKETKMVVEVKRKEITGGSYLHGKSTCQFVWKLESIT